MNHLFGSRWTIIALLLGLLSVPAPGQDVREAVAERLELFTQCTPNRADLLLDRAHSTEVLVYPASDGSVWSAQVAGPGGFLGMLTNSGNAFLLDLPSSLPSAAGAYTFSISTRDQGPQSLKVALPGVANGILPLRVANFAEAQLIDATQDFLLAWDKAPKLNAHDYILLKVTDTNGTTVFSMPQMDIGTTNVVIPAGTLQPTASYRAYLYLKHYFWLHNAREPFLAAEEYRITYFKLHTLNPSGVFRFQPQPVLAREQDGLATVTVERLQGSATDATVDYFCFDGSAHSNENYVAVAGTLDFPPGVTNQTISVPLLNDGVATRPLDFHLTLTNATGGAGLVLRPHTAVSILDAESGPGTNVNACMLAKVRFYFQSGTNLPSQSNSCVAARFYASIHPRFPGAVTNASWQLPKGPAVVMTNSGSFLEYDVDFPSAAAMDKAFPGGRCRFLFDTLTDGSFSPTLALGAERVFPVPHLSNWAELQVADPSGPITLQWDAFQGATSNDVVRVSIRDATDEYLVETPAEFEAGALAATTRSYVIPAGKLNYGQTYLVDVVFAKVNEGKPVDSGIRNGMVSVHTTSFYLHTIAASPAGAAVPASPAEVACPCSGW